MTELERQLRALDIAWPDTPQLRLELERRRRRGVLVASLAVVMLAATFAVPQSRSAILRLFHLGGVTVVRVDTLPPAQERPLAAGLGEPISDDQAVARLGTAFLPSRHGQLFDHDGFVSTLLHGPVLLTEFGDAYMLKKLATSSIESTEVAPGITGFWIAGDPHVVFFFPGASPRLAGNTLVWVRGHVTFRLEGQSLAKADALRLAREILGTTAG
jgi:hypothetical protein